MPKFLFITGTLLLLICFLGNEGKSQTTPIAKDSHGVMVLVPRLTMEQFYQLMEKDEGALWEGAHVIALNRGTAAQTTLINEVLTITSGRKAKSEEDSLHWYKSGHAHMEHKFTLPSFYEVKKENEHSTHRAVLGSLGESLQQASVHTSFTGHSHVFEKQNVFAPFFTMNGSGETYGNPFVSVDKREEAPGGYEMNGEKAFQWLRQVQTTYPATWLVVEWGDFYRAYEEKVTSSVEEEMVAKLASFLRQLQKENISLFLLGVGSPTGQEKMIPFANWTADRSLPPASFYSHTVQQPFLGSNIEIAPTISSTYHLSPHPSWQGAPLQRGEMDPREETMERALDGVSHIFHSRAVILSTYIGMLVILLVGSFVHLQYTKRKKSSRWLKHAVLAGMASPVVFVIVPLLFGRELTSIPLYVMNVFVFSLMIGMIFNYFARDLAVWGMSFFLLLILSIDIVLGSPLMKQSYLGFDPLIGARYSGIGNELGGFFVAGSIIFLEPFVREEQISPMGIGFMIAFLILLGAPIFGTNAGVTVAAGCMYLVWVWLIYKQDSSNSYLLFMLLPLGGLVIIGMLWFMQQFGITTHIGRFFQLILEGNWQEVISILQRKMEMNVKIMKHSRWTNLLLTSYVLIVLYILIDNHHQLSKVKQTIVKAGSAGSVFLLLLNDSGVVAAATAMFYLLCARYVWTLQAKLEEK